MANGFSLSALAGRRDVMSLKAIEPTGMERTFLLSLLMVQKCVV